MIKVILSSILFCGLFTSSISCAFDDYDVDFEPSKEPGISIVRITVDGCTSKFKVKEKDFKSFSKSDAALEQILDLAIDRAAKGCQ